MLIIVLLTPKNIVLQDLKDYMRQAGEVTFTQCHRDRIGEGWVSFMFLTTLSNMNFFHHTFTLSWIGDLSSLFLIHFIVLFCWYPNKKNMVKILSNYSSILSLFYMRQSNNSKYRLDLLLELNEPNYLETFCIMYMKHS